MMVPMLLTCWKTVVPCCLFALWRMAAPDVVNHLWQSTLFALCAAFLTLILQKNSARIRYWIWLAASVQFLIPFSLLGRLGGRAGWSRTISAAHSGTYFAVDTVSFPLTHTAAAALYPMHTATVAQQIISLFPAILAAVWFCGSAIVLFRWRKQWRRITRIVRGSAELREGREFEVLHSLNSSVRLLLASESLEPGIFGIMQPVLLWPESIGPRLNDEHLRAILAHEVSHVQRRDNLTAALHMLVEAIFWFHPLVWWIGAQMVKEREFACDEEVVKTYNQPGIYAESILKVCEFCLESPLACISGVTGADLKTRVAHIMSNRATIKLSTGRKLLLIAAGLTAVAVPIALGARTGSLKMPAKVEDLGYASAAITPDRSNDGTTYIWGYRYTAHNTTLKKLVMWAYDTQLSQITTDASTIDASWINEDRYDVVVQAQGDDQPSLQQWRVIVQKVLADRFKLSIKNEEKMTPVYALAVDAGGLKMTEDHKDPNGPPNDFSRSFGDLAVRNASMPEIAFLMQAGGLDRPVMDRTDLPGKYDFTLKWRPGAAPSAPDGLFSAMQQQLGLRLDATTAPLETLTIAHAEKPLAN